MTLVLSNLLVTCLAYLVAEVKHCQQTSIVAVQVLHIQVEATGMARRVCAPREVIVERLFKREDAGVDVILFSSIEAPISSPRKRRGTGSTLGLSSSGAAGGGAVNGGGGSSNWSAGWGAYVRPWEWHWPSWYSPVKASVRGGYTISPREDCAGAQPECLVTCILKVRET